MAVFVFGLVHHGHLSVAKMNCLKYTTCFCNRILLFQFIEEN